ncbi:5-carboxymethyl-2-hydroxymuconate Delta-isomerase [Ekhidna sp. To15]|uniref:5-carboxymethyl-2-hydroxymuconate Delta-isomerase n=1 Tax=Ekhidna sp. To15 TaxID=3395267 RepID=UPI003F51E19F
MPHFLLHTTKETIAPQQEEGFLKAIHEEAVASGLFAEKDIKVRMERFEKSMVGGKINEPFVHVFGYIMQGRSTEKKAALSRSIVARLNKLLPDVEAIAMNVDDFEAATYCNKAKL